jgi:hypothetical protein
MAYPDLVKAGYFRCVSCHASPGGSDLLTSYGRTISREMLSTWGSEGSEKPLHGFADTPDWLMVGGHIRSVQTYLDNEYVTKGTFFPMQGEVGAGVSYGPVTVAASVGVEGGREDREKRGDVISPWHYLIYNPYEELRVRVGKFTPYYGHVSVHHIDKPRSEFGFGPGSEKVAAEFSFSTETLGFYLTGFQNRPELEVKDDGVSFTAEAFLNDQHRLGLNYRLSETETAHKRLMGLHGQYSQSETFWVPAQIDIEDTETQNAHGIISKFVGWVRPTYQVTKGVNVYAIYQNVRPDWSEPTLTQWNAGLGSQIFPIPHLDFTIQLVHEEVTLVEDETDKAIVGWFTLHYYL